MWTSLFIFGLLYCIVNAEIYNTYKGIPATEEEIAEYQENNIAHICTASFEPCKPSELRRPDASCNNLNYPSHGMAHTRKWRMLPAEFGENFEPRLTSEGKPFPLARDIRQLLVKVGTATSEVFSTAGAYFLEFIAGETISIHDISNLIFGVTDCCLPSGQTNFMCAPNKIPPYDNVHRFSNIRCHNNTRPITYQTTGCVPNNTVPARINYATTHFDLSSTYVTMGVSLAETRTFQGGRLKVEVIDGQSYPSAANENTTCTIAVAAKTGCQRNVPNALLGTNIFTTWFWRHHNMIADGLAKLNRCWDDEKLFRVALDINIAYYTHILFYEYLPLILGRKHLIREGIILPRPGFRDIYNKNIPPRISDEFIFTLRWFHGIQASQQKMYDEHGNYVKTRPMVNFTIRVQDLPFHDNMLGLTHGLYIQPSGEFDDTADPDRIDLLKLVYKDVSDVELMAGMWSEEFMTGTWVPPTVYCLLVKELRRIIITDRFWFENPNRPNALTNEQMRQITSGSFAGLLCAIGDRVTEIQPEAFRRIGPGNRRTSCTKIPKLDLTPWKDFKCY